MKKSKLFSRLLLPCVLGVITLGLYYAYYMSETVLEKILIGFGFITFLIPVSINCLVFMIKQEQGGYNTSKTNTIKNNRSRYPGFEFTAVINKKPASEQGINKFNIDMPIKSEPIIPISYKREVRDPEYLKLRSIIITSSKNRLFSRDDILYLKSEIDYRLGVHKYEYDGFTFQNDFHEIYSKLKSSKLKTDDYRYLFAFTSKIIENSKYLENDNNEGYYGSNI